MSTASIYNDLSRAQLETLVDSLCYTYNVGLSKCGVDTCTAIIASSTDDDIKMVIRDNKSLDLSKSVIPIYCEECFEQYYCDQHSQKLFKVGNDYLCATCYNKPK